MCITLDTSLFLLSSNCFNKMPVQSTDGNRFHYALEGMENPYTHLDETILNERVGHLLFIFYVI